MSDSVRKKKKYVSPKIVVVEVFLEESFINTSSIIEFSGLSDEQKVEEWTTKIRGIFGPYQISKP